MIVGSQHNSFSFTKIISFEISHHRVYAPITQDNGRRASTHVFGRFGLLVSKTAK